MPKVPMPALHRDLTDHFIRVHDRKHALARSGMNERVRLKPDLLGTISEAKIADQREGSFYRWQ